MEGKTNNFEIFIGKKVKLVVKEPGDLNPKAIFGKVKNVDNNFLFFESQHGIGCYNLDVIIAIKPIENRRGYHG